MPIVSCRDVPSIQMTGTPLIISAVDNVATRKLINEVLKRPNILCGQADSGNNNHHGVDIKRLGDR